MEVFIYVKQMLRLAEGKLVVGGAIANIMFWLQPVAHLIQESYVAAECVWELNYIPAGSCAAI